MVYCSVLKREKILIHASLWMNLEDFMLSEVSQTQKDKYCITPLIKAPGMVNFIETGSRMVVAKD